MTDQQQALKVAHRISVLKDIVLALIIIYIIGGVLTIVLGIVDKIPAEAGLGVGILLTGIFSALVWSAVLGWMEYSLRMLAK